MNPSTYIPIIILWIIIFYVIFRNRRAVVARQTIKKRKMEKLQEEYPGAIIFDITSSSPYKGGQLLSPFYPHKNIPIPGDSKGMTAYSVEGIWQGLKVFEHAGIDMHSFRNDTMKDIKRTVRKFGRPLGHQFGVYSKELLSYLDAKRLIYAPAYKYVLENVPEVKGVIEKIRQTLLTAESSCW